MKQKPVITEPVVVSTPVVAETVDSIDSIMSRIAAAVAAKNPTEVMRLDSLLRKQSAAIQALEALRLEEEAKLLFGDREALATTIYKVVSDPSHGFVEELGKVKATGFTFKVDSGGVAYQSVELLVAKPPTKKVKVGGGVGGERISTKTETGLSLSELINQYATEAEKADIQAAYDQAEDNKGSARWQEQCRVKSRILKDNPSLIKS